MGRDAGDVAAADAGNAAFGMLGEEHAGLHFEHDRRGQRLRGRGEDGGARPLEQQARPLPLGQEIENGRVVGEHRLAGGVRALGGGDLGAAVLGDADGIGTEPGDALPVEPVIGGRLEHRAVEPDRVAEDHPVAPGAEGGRRQALAGDVEGGCHLADVGEGLPRGGAVGEKDRVDVRTGATPGDAPDELQRLGGAGAEQRPAFGRVRGATVRSMLRGRR